MSKPKRQPYHQLTEDQRIDLLVYFADQSLRLHKMCGEYEALLSDVAHTLRQGALTHAQAGTLAGMIETRLTGSPSYPDAGTAAADGTGREGETTLEER